MLKITRRAGERIMIGDEIVVTLLEVSGGTARLGIEAPRAIPVYREEIWVEVKRENEAVAGAAGTTLPAVAAGATPVSAPGVTLTSDA
ncbi:MAG: carbon storage regulator CsrA [Solirubrobacteraceae bacterium]|jgi:carbon storage regulator